MRLTFLWSESAIAAAGDGFAAIEATLLEDVKDIAAHARSWFVHSSPPDGSFPTYLCDGEETGEGWTVTVRVARYEPATSSEGRQVMFARPIGPADEAVVERSHEVDVERPVPRS
jgi:hypothetical protein